ncbi:glutamate ABC transporter substrate-binding protein [Gordonia sp. HY442]|uniref:glutamate ABC transporter substrate-binding protein n=1 Tax=Gordonia zhenghanii TaxID=2911516 RepID=UPI001F411182|nr:glutamate ABC transporter substrate-binding protein [Gordonia zhenghanii]MCF8604234.1 glutamate ABC transporter substrate-binding protein [Gordonia zhenghanii]
MTRRPRIKRGGSKRGLTVAVLAVAVTVGLGACGVTTSENGEPPTTTAEVPLPPNVSFDDSARGPSPSPESTDCDTSSLRPQGELPTPGQMPAHSTMEQILKRGRLVVGTDLGSNPLSFRDPLTGDVMGFDVDIAHWISAAIFGDPNRVDYRMVSSDNRIEALQNGTVDMVVKSMSITCERLASIDFSIPYFEASQRILAYRHTGIESVADLDGKRVCVSLSSTSANRVKELAPKARFATTASWADCLVMMQQGQVDAITSDTPILAGIAAQDPWARVVGESLGAENYGVGVAKGHPDFVEFINAVLEKRRADGSWHSSYDRWLSVLGPGSPPPYTYRD